MSGGVDEALANQARACRSKLFRFSAHHSSDIASRVLAWSELGHRAQVVELEVGGSLRANAKKRFVEFRFHSALRLPSDRFPYGHAFGRHVPYKLPVLLDEVGVALRVLDDHIDRAGFKRYVKLLGRLGKGSCGLAIGELADAREPEESLRV